MRAWASDAALTGVSAEGRLAVAAALPGFLLVGVGVVLQPYVTIMILAAPLLLAVVASAKIRVTAIVLGGLLALESSQSLDYPKLAYLTVVVVAVAASLPGLLHRLPRLTAGEKWLLRAAVSLSVLAVISSLASSMSRVTPDAWFRDVTPYLLMAAFPIVAVDAGARIGRRYTQSLLYVAGSLAALSLTVSWVSRRGFTDLPLDRFLFPSTALAAALLCLAAGHYFVSRVNRARDVAVIGVILALALTTGSRTNLLLLLPLPVIAAVSSGRLRLPRLGLLVAGGAVTTAVLIPVVASVAGFDVSRVVDRIGGLVTLLADPNLDQSYSARLSQNAATWSLFQSSPLIGTGPGTLIPWVTISNGAVTTSWNSDAPTAFLSKFGLVGLGLLGATIWCLFAAAMSPRKAWRTDVPSLALVGLLTLLTASMAIGSAVEDKGYAFGLLLLFGAKLAGPVSAIEVARSGHAWPRGPAPPVIARPAARPLRTQSAQLWGEE
jgi:hypothetical protein